MALIKCPKCGKEFSDRAQACPQCSTPKEEVLHLIAEKEAAEAAERERLRKEREAKEAEEARIRAEKRAEWWAANKKKVGISILIIIGIIAAIIIAEEIKKTKAEKKAVEEAYVIINKGEELISAQQYLEARDCYKRALLHTNDTTVAKLVYQKQQELATVERQNPFTSPDLKWAGVHGYVKKIQENIPRTPLYPAQESEYQFDNKGNLKALTINGKAYQINRSSTGQIEYIKEADLEGPDGTGFVLNSEDFVIQKYESECEVVTETSYVLNDAGIPVSAESRQWDNAVDTVLQIYSFTYSSYDTFGNWIARKNELTLMYETPQVVNTTTYRTITYWEE